MSKRSQPANPFYVLVVLVGILFTLTACSYGVMAFRRMQASAADQPESGLLVLLEERGMQIMAVEVALLAVVSIAAMGSDRYWTARSKTPAAKTKPDETSAPWSRPK